MNCPSMIPSLRLLGPTFSLLQVYILLATTERIKARLRMSLLNLVVIPLVQQLWMASIQVVIVI